MKGLGGGFLGLGNTFRAMTAVPAIRDAVSLAHRVARQRLESGGSAGLKRKRTAVRASGGTEFMLPLDIEPLAFAQILRAKLGGGETDDALYPLQRKKLGGRVVLHGRHILRLGDGRFSEGRAFLRGLIKDQRAKRWRRRFTPR